MTTPTQQEAMYEIVVATGNPGKLAEIQALLPADFHAVSLAGFDLVMPPETGLTFQENAVLKAQFVADQTGRIAIADDSGLEVDALEGRPGVFSARFSGENASDDANIDKLLEELREIAPVDRAARFVCAIAVAAPGTLLATAHGALPGSIAFERRGIYGFGYDPVLRLEDGRHLAELEPVEKNRISHRANAMRALDDQFDLLRNRPEAKRSGNATGIAR